MLSVLFSGGIRTAYIDTACIIEYGAIWKLLQNDFELNLVVECN